MLPADSFHAIVQGTVGVQLYTLDEDGEYIYVSWDDAYDGEFVFGSHFVAAYNIDEEGDATYYEHTVIRSPQTTGDSYEMEIHAEVPSLRVYAANDYRDDRIIGSYEPVGNFPDLLVDPDPEDPYNLIPGVDIQILLPYWDGIEQEDCVLEKGRPSTPTEIEGTVILTSSYAAGEAAGMIVTPQGQGPCASGWAELEDVGGGAEGEYELSSASFGEMLLLGAHDANYNGLIDPAGDAWGVYISEPGLDGNPVQLNGGTQSNMDIQIPLESDGLSLTPFVRIYGEVSSAAKLAEGAQVYVGALKYRPDTDLNVSGLVQGYDYAAFSSAEVSTGGPWSYDLIVPAETITYLWAYGDMDNDGRINETGEPVGSATDDPNGRLPTGELSQNYDIEMNIVK